MMNLYRWTMVLILALASATVSAKPLFFMGSIEKIKITAEKRELVVEGDRYKIAKYAPVTEMGKPISVMSLKRNMRIKFEYTVGKKKQLPLITKIEVFTE